MMFFKTQNEAFKFCTGNPRPVTVYVNMSMIVYLESGALVNSKLLKLHPWISKSKQAEDVHKKTTIKRALAVKICINSKQVDLNYQLSTYLRAKTCSLRRVILAAKLLKTLQKARKRARKSRIINQAKVTGVI